MKVLEPRVGSVLRLALRSISPIEPMLVSDSTPFHALTFAVVESKVRTVEMAERLTRAIVSRRNSYSSTIGFIAVMRSPIRARY